MKKTMRMQEFLETELPHLTDVVRFTNSLEMSLYANSTVVKSPEVVFRGLVFSRNRFLSEQYLLNFQRSDADFGRPIGIGNYSLPMVHEALSRREFKQDDGDLIKLPPHRSVNVPIGPVMRSRRSVRTFSGTPQSLDAIATILFHAQGITGRLAPEDVQETVSLGENSGIALRAAPSGGGLYPIDLYLVPLRVVGLSNYPYLYVPDHHALKPVKSPGEEFKLSEAAQFGEIEVDKANFLLIYAYRLLDNSRKYGDCGLAYALIETGQIAENVHLTCAAMGLGSCDVGGFRKHRLEAILGLDGLSQHVVLISVVGS
jgi:SagB-type dehydrogenase family enzyme